MFATVRDRDGWGKLIDVILPVTELDRANQIFQRMLYQEPDRQPEAPTPERERTKERTSPEKGPAGAPEAPQDPHGTAGPADAHTGPPERPDGPTSGRSAKKRVSVGTRLARYKNQLLYPPRPRNYD